MALATVLLSAPGAAAATLPTGFEEIDLATGLTEPTAVDFAPDGRMFIAEKQGRVKVVPAGGGPVTQILDISAHVSSELDRGLLGIAVDRDFATNNFLWLLYVYEGDPFNPSGPKSSRLTRVSVLPDNSVSSETTVLGTKGTACATTPSNTEDCIPADDRMHTIGTVISDPVDGTLWVGSGDANTANTYPAKIFRTYDERSLAGKIMHVDRQGRGLPGHRFCPTNSDLTQNCTKLYAKGFRNPFRFTKRPGAAGLAVGDVGQASREEIDLIPPTGAAPSYGWPCYEGNIRMPVLSTDARCSPEYAKEGTSAAHLPPTFDCAHPTCNSLLAGPTYTGTAYPTAYHGDIFYGDYTRGFINHIDVNSSNAVTSNVPFATDIYGWVDLKTGPNGDLVYVDIGNALPGQGAVRQIRYAPGNRAPTARATGNPTSGAAPLTVNFTGDTSTDPDGNPLTYEWDFGDGSAHSSAANPSHTYTNGSSNFTATLTVRDGQGGSDTDTVQVSPGNSPPTIGTLNSPATFRAGSPVALSGSATDPNETLPASAYKWTIRLRHGTHFHAFTELTGPSVNFTTIADHDADSRYEVVLTVTDARGLKDTESAVIDPETVQVTLATSPTGAPVSYDDISGTGPLTRTAAIGYHAQVSAQPSYTSGGQTYFFDGWSDGGARQHQVTVPATNTTLTASYRQAPPSAYRNAVLTTAGLRSYWRLGESSGTVAADLFDGSPGTYVGGPALGRPGSLTGDPDTAVAFDGVNDELTMSGAGLALTTAGGTIEGWFKWSTGGVLMRDHTSSAGWILAMEWLGNVSYRVGGVQFNTSLPIGSVRDGNWHHIALTRTETATALYIDGANVHSGTGPGDNTALMPWHVMRNGTTTQFTPGTVDDLAIYDRSLSAATIAGHYAARVTDPAPAPPTGLTATGGDGSVGLDWANNSESDLAGYNVYRATVSGGPYVKANTSLVTASQFNDTGRTNGVTYYYVVRAVDTAGGESGDSNQASATPAGSGTPGYRDAVMGTAGLLSYWRLGEASGTTATDSQGSNNGTYLGGLSLGQAGALTGDSNTAAGFDGVNDEATFPGASIALTTAGTIEGFFRWSAGGVLFRDSTSGGGWILAFDNLGTIAYRVGGVTFNTTRSTASLRDGEWHHLALTVSAGTANLYIDGALARSATGAGTTKAVMPWHAMRNGSLSQYAQGRVDELAVYDRALSAATIANHYAARSTVPDPPPAAPTGLTATAGDGSVDLNWNDNSESDLDGYDVYRGTSAGGPYTKVNGALVTSSQFTDGGRTNGTTYYYVVRAVDDAGGASTNSNEAFATPSGGGATTYRDAVMGTSGLLSYWRLGEASGTSAADSNGTNNGTFVGGPLLGQAGALTGDSNTAAGFDGTNDEVTLPGTNLGLTTQGTLEGFFRWDAGGVLFRDSTTQGGWILAFDNAGTISYRAGGSTFTTTRATATVRDGNWHHFALTANAGNASLYIDGALVRSASGAGSVKALVPWHAMRNGTLAAYTQGRADELAIYNRALTAAEVQQHYAAR